MKFWLGPFLRDHGRQFYGTIKFVPQIILCGMEIASNGGPRPTIVNNPMSNGMELKGRKERKEKKGRDRAIKIWWDRVTGRLRPALTRLLVCT